MSKPKRKTWRDRRCHHGKVPTMRLIYDFIHCDGPKCFDDVLARCGFRRLPEKRKKARA